MSIGLPFIAPDRSSSGLNRHEIRINPDESVVIISSDDASIETAGSVWHAGVTLSHFLGAHPEFVKGKRVIELGSGCGMCGLAAARVGAVSVALTDLDAQQDHLRANIDANSDIIITTGCEVNCATLTFGEPAPIFRHGASCCGDIDDFGPFDVILGADIGYDPSLHEPIAKTIQSLIRHHYRNRNTATLSAVDSGALIIIPRDIIDILLVEEVRWKDIHQWYVDTISDYLVHRKEVPVANDISVENEDEALSSSSYCCKRVVTAKSSAAGDVDGIAWSGTMTSQLLNGDDSSSLLDYELVKENSVSSSSYSCKEVEVDKQRNLLRSKHPIMLHHIRCCTTVAS